ncbi:hypothetical protein ACIBKZ_09820 [Streptomyces sp. NPDC050421]|uniref:hypothetical protein n=1 Tax=Streptomyces sp. NPDC050421 TaxID=3365613 RepID=UPI0037BAEBD0
MSIPTPSDPAAVAVELERMRGTMAEGFATVNGSLALLAQRTDQTDRRLEDHENRLDVMERGETERQKRDAAALAELQRARWPLPSIAALVGLVSLVLALYQLSQK